jgi:hypothetical protein
MNRLHSSLLLSLTLLTAACEKDEKTVPAEEAPLEGTWQWQRATNLHYDAQNKLFATTPQIWQPGDFSLIITGQTIRTVDNKTQYTVTSPYTRQDSVITYTNFLIRRTIRELTARTLTLYTRGEYSAPSAGNFGGRTDSYVYYTR